MAEPTANLNESPNAPKKQGGEGNAFLRAARNGQLDKVLEFLNQAGFDLNLCNANGLTALHLASKEGHVSIVYELLKRGANVDAATKKGNTALHIAALAGQLEVVKLLVQYAAKVNVQSQNGFTPLYMAAQENHYEVVQFLLANGANQSITTDDGFTPLAVALQQGHERVVALLIDNDSRGRVRLPALHIAAKKDDVKAAALLLQQEPDAMHTQATSGFTPLHIASHYGNVNVATLLMERGADVNFPAKNNICPLHVASKWGKLAMVQLLLEHQALVDCLTKDGLTPLHCAARSGQNQVLELLLAAGANYSAATRNGLTPLHMAAQGDHVDCARMLVNRGCRVDDITIDSLTPLHVASHCGNVRMAKLLLERNADINSKATNGFTPLHVACKKNRIKVVELLLRFQANLEAATESGLTSLHVSAFMGHQNIVLLLLQTGGASPNAVTQRGETPLHLAARANQLEIVRILLRHGAHVDAKAKENQTPLHIACRLGNAEVVALLLQHGASADAATKDNYAPLHIAAKEGHEEVVRALLEAGAKVDVVTRKGFTALHICAKYDRVRVARLLLARKSNPDLQGKNGLTPLHVAVHYAAMPVIQLLLEHKASPNAAAKNGYSALHIAAKRGQLEVARLLLEAGAKAGIESKSGFTPMHLAAQEGRAELVTLLARHEASANQRAKNGLTALHLAAQDDHVPVAQVLVDSKAELDPSTKAGYTPLHTASHFGKLNMIDFLLRHGVLIDQQTKLGYTPLHLASQQGHLEAVKLLCAHGANVNLLTAPSQQEQSALSIARALGYEQIASVLERTTTVQAAPMQAGQELHAVSPEVMQEAYMSDDDEDGEGGGEFASSPDVTIRSRRSARGMPRSKSAARSQENMVSMHRQHAGASSTMRSSASGDLGVTGEFDSVFYDVTPARGPTRTPRLPSQNPSRNEFLESLDDIKRDMEYMPSSEQYGPLARVDSLRDPESVTARRVPQQMSSSPRVAAGGSLTSIMWDAYQYGVSLAAPTLTVSPPSQWNSQAYANSLSASLEFAPHHLTLAAEAAVPDQSNVEDMRYLNDPSIMPGKDLLEEKFAQQQNKDETSFEIEKSPLVEAGMTRGSGEGAALSPDQYANVDADNVPLDRTPTFSGFLVSFMVDARGGAMQGSRYPGLRVVVPPRAATMPTRITCRLLRRERLTHLPALNAAEGLATRIIELGPTNLKFNAPVLIEVPHFASLRENLREVVVLRSENGEKWTEHTLDATDAAVKEAVGSTFGDVEPATELVKKRVARILTTDFPMYFALVSRVHLQLEQVGPEGGLITSPQVSQVQAVFPEGALQKRIKIGLQAQKVPPEQLLRAAGSRVTVSPIVTIEPRRRKFHRPITLAIPISKHYEPAQINMQPPESQSLRLLCSITDREGGGAAPVQWEDITGSTPLAVVRGCITFTTTVSARFWLVDTPSPGEALEVAKRLYSEQCQVPYMARFLVYAKRTDPSEARLRCFCVTDDRIEKTLEMQEKFIEVARSNPVEVFDSRPQWLQLAGNLVPLTKQGEEQPHLTFQAFRENRLPLVVRLRDATQAPIGRLVFEREPLALQQQTPGQQAAPVVVLNLQLPEMGAVPTSPTQLTAEQLAKVHPQLHELRVVDISEEYYKADFKIADVARELGADWLKLAPVLGLPQAQIDDIHNELEPDDQPLESLVTWTKLKGPLASGNELANALKTIGRADIVAKVMRNESRVTDEREIKKAVSRASVADNVGSPELSGVSAQLDEALNQPAPEPEPVPLPPPAATEPAPASPGTDAALLRQYFAGDELFRSGAPAAAASRPEDDLVQPAVSSARQAPAATVSDADKQAAIANLVSALEEAQLESAPAATRESVPDVSSEEAISAVSKEEVQASVKVNYRPGHTQLGNAAPITQEPEESEKHAGGAESAPPAAAAEVSQATSAGEETEAVVRGEADVSKAPPVEAAPDASNSSRYKWQSHESRFLPDSTSEEPSATESAAPKDGWQHLEPRLLSETPNTEPGATESTKSSKPSEESSPPEPASGTPFKNADPVEQVPDEVMPAGLSTDSATEAASASTVEELKSEPAADQQMPDQTSEEPQQQLEHDVTIEEPNAEPVPEQRKGDDPSNEEAPASVADAVVVAGDLLAAAGEAAASITDTANPEDDRDTISSELQSKS